MTHEFCDVAIIGGGHNGLTCAAYLGAAGLKVVVLEKNAVVGGAAVTEEFHPGFRNSVAAYTVSLLNPTVIADLELARHGLRIVERPVANFWPVDERRYLLMPYGLANRQRAIAAFSAADAERLPAYDAALERAASLMRDLALRRPPNAGGGILELAGSAGLGRRLFGLTLADKRLVLDLFTKSAADFLDGWFESEVIKGALAFDGIVGAYASPYTPGTAYVLLHHCFGEVNGKTGVWGHAVGGMGAISAAMAHAARSHGATIRTEAEVASLVVDGGRVSGVRLRSGELVAARAVAANVPPKLLFRDLVPPGAIEPNLHRRFTGLKSGSGTFRMNVALSELPDFCCRPGKIAQDHSLPRRRGLTEDGFTAVYFTTNPAPGSPAVVQALGGCGGESPSRPSPSAGTAWAGRRRHCSRSMWRRTPSSPTRWSIRMRARGPVTAPSRPRTTTSSSGRAASLTGWTSCPSCPCRRSTSTSPVSMISTP